MSNFKHINVEIVDEVSVVHLADDDYFDRLTIHGLQDELLQFAKNESLPKLLISFGRVKTMSSEVINTLLRVRDWVVGNDGQIMLCDMRDTIREVFKVMRLEGKIFKIYDSMPKALDSFKR